MRNGNSLRGLLMAVALTTSLAGCTEMARQEMADESLDDATITTKIMASIVNELGGEQIGVETVENIVELSGYVDSPQIKGRADRIARHSLGVRDVHNNIIVR